MINPEHVPGSYDSGTPGRISYGVDLVLCIDGTRTMNDPAQNGTTILESVKAAVKQLPADLMFHMSRVHKLLGSFRVRLVVFRDYLADGPYAMQITDFFRYPQGADALNATLDSIIADGGGDLPEDGLEALAYAIHSKWNMDSVKKRHIIMLWTDAPAHDLGHGASAAHYPKGMPKNMEQLTAQWDGMDYIGKRLVLYAPDEGHWRYISDNWDNVIHFPSPAGIGITESIYNCIFSALFDV